MNIFKKKKDAADKGKTPTERKSSSPSPILAQSTDRRFSTGIQPLLLPENRDPILSVLDEGDTYISSARFLQTSKTGRIKDSVVVLCNNSFYRLTENQNKPRRVFSMADETPRKSTKNPLTPTKTQLEEPRFERVESTGVASSNIATGIHMPLRNNFRVSWKMPFQFVHAVTSDKEDERSFIVTTCLNKTAKGITHEMKFTCESEHDREEWVLIFSRALQEFFQQLFEDNLAIIQDPEVYQHHFYTKNVKKNVQCVILSNKRAYVVKMQQGDEKKNIQLKAAIPYNCISSLAQKSNDSIIIKLDKAELKDKVTKSLDSSYTFTPDGQNLQHILEQIRRLYFWATHKKIKDEYVP
jgi:ribosomal protein L21E